MVPLSPLEATRISAAVSEFEHSLRKRDLAFHPDVMMDNVFGLT